MVRLFALFVMMFSVLESFAATPNDVDDIVNRVKSSNLATHFDEAKLREGLKAAQQDLIGKQVHAFVLFVAGCMKSGDSNLIKLADMVVSGYNTGNDHIQKLGWQWGTTVADGYNAKIYQALSQTKKAFGQNVATWDPANIRFVPHYLSFVLGAKTEADFVKEQSQTLNTMAQYLDALFPTSKTSIISLLAQASVVTPVVVHNTQPAPQQSGPITPPQMPAVTKENPFKQYFNLMDQTRLSGFEGFQSTWNQDQITDEEENRLTEWLTQNKITVSGLIPINQFKKRSEFKKLIEESPQKGNTSP